MYSKLFGSTMKWRIVYNKDLNALNSSPTC